MGSLRKRIESCTFTLYIEIKVIGLGRQKQGGLAVVLREALQASEPTFTRLNAPTKAVLSTSAKWKGSAYE